MFQILYGIKTTQRSDLVVAAAMAKGLYLNETSDGSGTAQASPCGEGIGFLTQQVVAAGGIDWLEKEYVQGTYMEKVEVGQKIRVVDGPGEFVTDDTDLLITTTSRAISGATAGLTGSCELTVFGGKWGLAVTGDVIMGRLEETDWRDNSGQYRIKRVIGNSIKA